jgi:hypothetical protein
MTATGRVGSSANATAAACTASSPPRCTMLRRRRRRRRRARHGRRHAFVLELRLAADELLRAQRRHPRHGCGQPASLLLALLLFRDGFGGRRGAERFQVFFFVLCANPASSLEQSTPCSNGRWSRDRSAGCGYRGEAVATVPGGRGAGWSGAHPGSSPTGGTAWQAPRREWTRSRTLPGTTRRRIVDAWLTPPGSWLTVSQCRPTPPAPSLRPCQHREREVSGGNG